MSNEEFKYTSYIPPSIVSMNSLSVLLHLIEHIGQGNLIAQPYPTKPPAPPIAR